jgi:hypothetical protein
MAEDCGDAETISTQQRGPHWPKIKITHANKGTKWVPTACASGPKGPKRIRTIFRLDPEEEIMLTTRKREGVPRTIVSVDEEWAEDEWLSPDEEYEFILDTDEQEDDAAAEPEAEAGDDRFEAEKGEEEEEEEGEEEAASRKPQVASRQFDMGDAEV